MISGWFIYSFLGVVFMAAFQISSRYFLKDKGDSLAFTLVSSLVGALTLIFFLPTEAWRSSFSTILILALLAVGFLTGLTDLVFAQARKVEEASRVAIAIQSAQIWFLFGSFWVFGEPLLASKIAGVFLILGGNVLIIWKGKQSLKVSPGVWLSLLGSLLFTIATFSDKSLLRVFSPVFYRTLIFGLEAVFVSLVLGRGLMVRLSREFRLQGKGLLMVGPFLALSLTFLNKALAAGGQASQVFPVFSLAVVFTTLSGIIFLGERENLGRKILAMLLAFAGVYLVSA